ncbi:glycosyltransferase family 2 protein [Marinoscillum pacificum]|uniref:glycosyltransferase family 2 protein n=1 Tax=Marinoscillum pacificum TaxID=392723 RepID=UPI00215745A1|nr:glycosyltransferase family 2 protein [Marinoscillum pacificum]
MQELVSVCIPCYNGEEYLEQCLQSVINQTYEHIEVLVIDESSADSSQRIVTEFARKDSRIKLIINERRLGLVENWNKCLEMAQGDWIKFQFQDDLMQPDCIEKMQETGKRNGTGLVLTDREYLCDNPERRTFFDGILTLAKALKEQEILVHPERIAEILIGNKLKHNFLGEPIVGLIHRSLIEKYGLFNTKYQQIVDFEYWLRIGLNEHISFVREKLNTFRVHSGSVSSSNIATIGPNPSYTDRVVLILDLLESSFYQKFRVMIGQEGVDELKTVLSHYVKKIGLLKSSRMISWSIIKYYNRGVFGLFRK